MSWLNNTGPVGGGKAGAALASQEDDDLIDAASFVPQPGSPSLPAASFGGALCDVHFLVQYSLVEYISFMWQHGGYLIRRRRIGALAGLYLRIKSTATAALHFVMLRRGRRTYEFTIDQQGIVRATTDAGGVTLIDWADVTAIRSYSRGFMMVLKRGTLPIPFRCLGTDGANAMRGYAAACKTAALH